MLTSVAPDLTLQLGTPKLAWSDETSSGSDESARQDHKEPVVTGVKHLTIPELAERLAVPVPTIYSWNSNGVGPPFLKIGRHVRYRLEDVEKWEKSRMAARLG
jgi:excisionase family DNA binding protein